MIDYQELGLEVPFSPDPISNVKAQRNKVFRMGSLFLAGGGYCLY